MSTTRSYSSHLGRARTAHNVTVNEMVHGVRSEPNEGAAVAFQYDHAYTTTSPIHRNKETTRMYSHSNFDKNFSTTRPSMNQNVLLQKHKTGEHKAVSANAEQLTHGVRSYKGLSVSDSMRWQEPALPKTVSASPRAGISTLDAITMNRLSVSQGMVTNKDYQKLKDSMKGLSLTKRKSDTFPNRKRPASEPPNIAFGLKTRFGDTVSDLITFKSMHEETIRKASIMAKPLSPRTFQSSTTRTCVLRAKVHEPEPAPYWKMSQFLRTGPVTQSFRTDADRAAARSFYEKDSVARLGTNFHHGIYKLGEI